MRQTQAERRHQTLQKLHKATVQCIVNHGFSRLKTTDIAESAGVSQGALFRYYATKTAAVVGATRYLFDQVMADFNALAAEQPDVQRLFDDLWRWFQSDDFVAVSRLFAESSADAELRQAIQPIVERHRNNIHMLLCELFPGESAELQRSAALAVIYLMQGIAAERHLIGDDAAEQKILSTIRQMAPLLVQQQNVNNPQNKQETKWNR